MELACRMTGLALWAGLFAKVQLMLEDLREALLLQEEYSAVQESMASPTGETIAAEPISVIAAATSLNVPRLRLLVARMLRDLVQVGFHL